MAVINDLGFPFTSVGGDRQYSSSEWRDYFKALVEGGVVGGVGNELEVKPQTVPNKTIFIDTGSILIEGAMRTIETTVDLSFADNTSGSARIDRVIARINYNDRKIEFVVKEGTTVAPTLTRDSSFYEMSLAQVTLANGYSTITTTEITDERQDEAVCGYFKYRARPAWYPEGDIPKEAWMYVAFKNELTSQEIADIESNPTLMSIINNYNLSNVQNHNIPIQMVTDVDMTTRTTNSLAEQDYNSISITPKSDNSELHITVNGTYGFTSMANRKAELFISLYNGAVKVGEIRELNTPYFPDNGQYGSFILKCKVSSIDLLEKTFGIKYRVTHTAMDGGLYGEYGGIYMKIEEVVL